MSTLTDPSGVFIIIPAYNEEKVILPVIDELLPLHYSIIVVDDGSQYPLSSILDNKPVYLLTHPVNLGQGAAIQTGIEFAIEKNAKYIVTFDADGQHQQKDIPLLLEPLITDEADIVLGSRFLNNSTEHIPRKRKRLLKFARAINFIFTGLRLSDAHNGLRAMNAKAASTIRIKENRMAHATEIISQIRKHQLRYREVPVEIIYTKYSKEKGQQLAGGFRIIFDLLLNKLSK
jgi:polyprenyl-phospho-N-acetylgalactosaminyl synthase